MPVEDAILAGKSLGNAKERALTSQTARSHRENNNERWRYRQLNVSAPADVELQASDDKTKKSLFGGLLTVGVALGRAGQNLLGNQSGVLPDRRLDFHGHLGIGLEEGFRVLAALSEPLAVI